MVCITAVALYTCSTLYLLMVYVRYARIQPAPPAVLNASTPLPKVTVQIPLYNERYVVRRVVEAVAALVYPRDRLHIQILDDSTDDTTDLIQGRIAQLRADGLRIELIHRQNRTGYKAGALANGLTCTDGDLIAVFDADFVPPPNFLQRVVPYFAEDERIGMVQTRWGHLNEDDNLLTHSQALAFDGHFAVEQFARNAGEIVLSFNGTGGVWRRTCIEDSGGWQLDTLTEDFDLSYRAQIRGWRMKYIRDVVVPGEIPPQMSAYKQQQARWAKGSTQVLLKLSGKLLRSDLSARNRIMGLFQMMQYAVQIALLTLLLLTPPMILLNAFNSLPIASFSVLTLSAPILYALGQQALYGEQWWRRMRYFPALLLFSCGMSFNNGKASVSALMRQPGEFKRTPKYHLNGRSVWWTRSQYAGLLRTFDIAGEITLGVYSLFGAAVAFILTPSMIVYMLIYATGYFLIVGWSLWDRWLLTHPARAAEPEPIRQPGR